MSFIIPSVQQVQIPDNDLLLFGNGSDGHFNSTANITLTAPTQDNDVISFSYLSFVLNAQHTINVVTNRNRGLIIRVLGDAIINGTISNNNLAARLTRNPASELFDSVAGVFVRNSILPVNTSNFLLPAGGNGGAGGGGTGGAGGAGGAFGGSGGGGGGSGASRVGGGGGGAGGGVVAIFYRENFINNGVINVSGSLGGAMGGWIGPGAQGGGGGGAGNGGKGGDGGGTAIGAGAVGGGTGGAGGIGNNGGTNGTNGGSGGGGLIILLVRKSLILNGSILALSSGNGGNGGSGEGTLNVGNGSSGQIGSIIQRRV